MSVGAVKSFVLLAWLLQNKHRCLWNYYENESTWKVRAEERWWREMDGYVLIRLYKLSFSFYSFCLFSAYFALHPAFSAWRLESYLLSGLHMADGRRRDSRILPISSVLQYKKSTLEESSMLRSCFCFFLHC